MVLLLMLIVGLLPRLQVSPAAAQAPPAALSHPRLLFTAEEIPLLRERAQTTHREIWAPIETYVNGQVGSAPPAQAPASGSEDDYRNAGDQIFAFAFACMISGQDDHCDLAKAYLLAYARWNQWGDENKRDLGQAHMMLGSALAYDWLYDHLTPEERGIVRGSLALWAQRMYEASVADGYRAEWVNWWPRSYMQNHYYINHAALGLTALALLDEAERVACTVFSTRNVNIRSGPGTEFAVLEVMQAGGERTVVGSVVGTDGYVWWRLEGEAFVRSDVVDESPGCASLTVDAQPWLDRAIDRISAGRAMLEGIADGSWHEGALYQNYMHTMTLPFMIALRDVQGIDLLPHTYLRNYTYWRLYNHVPGSDLPLMAFGDIEALWGNSYAAHATLDFIAAEYEDGHAAWLARELANATGRTSYVWTAPWYVFEFLYYSPEITPIPPDDLPLARTFPDFEGTIWRTGWGVEDTAFALKTGPYGGRFAFEAFTAGAPPYEPPCSVTGCQLLIGHGHNDANGFYLYSNGARLAPESFGFDRDHASYHNTVLIDGQDQYRPPDNLQGQYPEYFVGSEAALVSSVAASQHGYLLADATPRYRRAIQDVERYVRHVVFVQPDYFIMVDELAAGSSHQYEWVTHVEESVTREDRWLRGQGANGQVLGVHVAAPAEFEVSFGNDLYPYARTRPAAAVDDVRLVHLLYPTDEAGWAARPAVTVLQDDAQAVVLRVDHQDGSGRQDLIQFTLGFTGSTVDTLAFGSDARVIVVSRAGDGTLRSIFMHNGSYLFDMGADMQLVDHFASEGVFEAIYGDSVLQVSGDTGAGFQVYAQGAEFVDVNGDRGSIIHDGNYITQE